MPCARACCSLTRPGPRLMHDASVVRATRGAVPYSQPCLARMALYPGGPHHRPLRRTGRSRPAQAAPWPFHLDRAGLHARRLQDHRDLAQGAAPTIDFRRAAPDAIADTASDTWEASRSGCPSARSTPRNPNPCGRPWRAPRPTWAGNRGACTTSRSRRARSATSSSRSVPPGWPTARGSFGEAVWRRPRERARAQHARPRRLPGGARIPDRPLPRRGEAVQNLIALRFANGVFEPVWNRDHIDHVQIDVPETVAVDIRAGFYEGIGAYRDMVVTHLFHVLGFVAMRATTTLEARSIVEETGKVFGRSPTSTRPTSSAANTRLPRRPRRRRHLADGDVYRAARRHRQLALVRRALLPAHGEAPRRAAASPDHRIPRTATPDVPRRARLRGGFRSRPHLVRLW